MPTFSYTQSVFSRGELDPRLWSRTSFDGYTKAARELKNVLVVPQGGVRRRFGSDFIFKLTGSADKTEMRIVVLDFQDQTKYILVFENLLVTVIENTTVLTTVVSPYTKAQLPNVKFAQSDDVLISVLNTVEPYIFQRTAAPSTFTYTPVHFKNEPTYDFLDNYDHVKFTLGATAPADDVTLTISSTVTYPDIISKVNMITATPAWVLGDRYIHTGPNGTLTGFSIRTGDILEATVVVGNDWPPKADGTNIGSIPSNNSIVKDLSDGKFYEFVAQNGTWVLYGSSTFQFTRDYVGGVFIANTGTMRLTDFESPTVMRGTILNTFSTAGPIIGTEVVLTEPIFNKTHGYPRAVTFFQNRMWLGGTTDLPSGVYGSKPGANFFFDFDDSEGLADSAIDIYVTTGETNVVHNLIGAQELFVFTTGGVSVTRGLSDSAIEPGNISLALQTTNGISPNVEPLFFDSQVFFVDVGGKTVRSMQFDVQVEGEQDLDVSILSQHLIKAPVSIADFKNPTTDTGNYMIVVNGTDGTLAVFESLKNEDVKAWTQADTQLGVAKFRHITSSQNDVYFIVERMVNSVTVFYLEKLNFSHHMDSTIFGENVGPSTSITGLGSLESETVQLKGSLLTDAGMFYFGEFTVTGGAITAPVAVAEYEVGFKYTPTIKPLPIEFEGKNGLTFYQPKTYRTMFLDYYNSLGITVNGELIPDLSADIATYDAVPIPKSGFQKLTPMAGWDPYQIITISQITPFDMFIRALAFDVQID